MTMTFNNNKSIALNDGDFDIDLVNHFKTKLVINLWIGIIDISFFLVCLNLLHFCQHISKFDNLFLLLLEIEMLSTFEK